MKDSRKSGAEANPIERRRHVAWILILIADAGLLAWGAMAALWPDHLLGPGGRPILAAGYEGYSKSSWSDLPPMTARYTEVLFRMYGFYIVAFGLMAMAIATKAFRRGESWAWWALLVGNTIAYPSAMAYDQIVHAVGPFELTEYLGLAVIYGALAVTAPFVAVRRPGGQREKRAIA